MLAASPAPPKTPGSASSVGYVRPPTGGRLSQTRATSSSGRLTPMPDYMHPVTKSAAKRWRKLHEDHMMKKLIEKHNAKKQRNQQTKAQAQSIIRKIPLELLAHMWMKDHSETAETRAFLVDKVLPTLILGMEKLLMEVDQRGLAEEELSPDFNPLNFLAQYLMRNNPRYSNFSEASPYIRGLREVSEQLKQQLFDMDENRLVRIKAEARRKREEREAKERQIMMEKRRRETALHNHFKDWIITGSYPEKVDLALIQNAIRSFNERAQNMPPEILNAAVLKEVEPTDDTGRALVLKEYMEYMHPFIENLSSEMFDQLMNHMIYCANMFRSNAEKDARKAVLSQLFVSCDHAGVGVLDRHRVLNLFAMFYDKASDQVKAVLRNPRKWPVVHLEEEASDDEEDGEYKPVKSDNNAVVTQDRMPKGDDRDISELKKTEKADDEPEVPGKSKNDDESVVDPATSGHEAGGEKEPPSDMKVEDSGKTAAADSSEIKPETEKQPEDNSNPEDNSKSDEIPAEDETNVEDNKKLEESGKEKVDMTEKEEDESEKQLPKQDEDMGEGKKEEVFSAEKDLSSSSPIRSDERPPMTQQSRVSFAEGTAFERERTLLTSHGTRSMSQASVFDENLVNVSQFVHVTETFLGETPDMHVFSNLVRYIRDGYVETEEERMKRLLKARQEALEAKRKALLNSLFEMWDNDGSGFLDLDEVDAVMKKYKDGMDSEAMEKAKKEYKKSSKHADYRLTKREFREYVSNVVDHMGGERNSTFDFFIEFLINSVQRTYQERVRGEARKKWLQQIVTAAQTSGASLDPVYKAVFQALFKDAENHGGGKKISAYIAMLESNHVAPNRGPFMLRYTAATPNDADFLLGKALFPDMKGISFAVVESGKPIHVPRVANHGNIHFWNPERGQNREGSFIVVPLKNRKKRVFGVLGIDTLCDPQSRAIFITHEIQFFQGVAKSFSIAYHHVDVRQKTMRISESAVSWIHRRCLHVHDVTVYMVEPELKSQDYLLRKMVTTDHKGNAHLQKNPARLERKDNLFRDYLFKCVDNSESVTADAYGERHLAFPLRDDEGRAIVAIDISIGSEQKILPKMEMKEVMKMLRLLQMAYKEISYEAREGERSVISDDEQTDNASRTDILFDRLMLLELRDNVAKLDAKAYAELKSYKEPPPVIHNILKAVLAVFHHDEARQGYFDDWTKCKSFVNLTLSNKIMEYDPTGTTDYSVPVDVIHTYLDQVPHGAVSKHGSIPAQYLYNWVFVCISLIEHTRKMDANRQNKLVVIDEGQPLKQETVKQKVEAQPEQQTTKENEEPKEESKDQAQECT